MRLRILVGILITGIAALAASAAWQAWKRNQLEGYITETRRARNEHRWDDVLVTGAKWAERSPDDALPWLEMAHAAERKGNLGMTAELLAQLPDSDPRTPDGLLERSGLLFGPLNRGPEAATTCERILLLDPHHNEAYTRLLFYYAITGMRLELIDTARRAIRAKCDTPETYLYLMTADYIRLGNARQETARWLQGDPANDTLLAANLLCQINTDGEFKEGAASDSADLRERTAKEAFEELRRRFPENMELMVYELERASFRGDVERVANVLATAPANTEKDHRLWRYKGWLEMTLEQYDEAATSLQTGLTLYPFDWQAQHFLADVLRRQERFAEVEHWQNLSQRGRELQRTLLELPDTRSVPPKVFAQIKAHAEACGDGQSANRLNEIFAATAAAAQSPPP